MTRRARKREASPHLDLGGVRALHSPKDYDAAVREIDTLLDRRARKSSAAAARLELLSVLVEAYDRAHYPTGKASTPQSIVLFMLEQHQKSRADLIPVLGSKSRVSEFLSGKRRLSLAQVAALREQFGIPADLLIDSEKAFTYPAPAVRAAAVVREGPPSEGVESPAVKAAITQLSQAQREYFKEFDRRLAEHTRDLREITAELRRVKSDARN
jgi:HTH-type transcriptional regulator/antitoxin HigA